MNRLVIIGNGFDLAHGLPTSYKDFIDDYWQQISKSFYRHLNKQQYVDELIEVSYEFNTRYHDVFYSISSEIGEVKCYENFCDFIQKYSRRSNPIVYEDMNGSKFRFKNNFFKILNEKNSKNWVDIENEYYYQLKKIVKSKCLDVTKSEEYWRKQQMEKIEKLNNEFDEIKKLLEVYLFEKVINKYDFKIEDGNSVLKIFFPDKLEGEKITNYLDEFPIEDESEAKSNMFMLTDTIQNYSDNFQTSMMYKVIFLNFNYTPTSKLYIDEIKKRWQQSEIINIHGEVKNDEHPIVFGYGDEMDEDYKTIENFNDNCLLENIKSFQYLNKSNYKRLLDFIKQFGKFQVFILGHSCGLSDRVLLNTIFENENCRSIKVFYHKKDNEKDNYTEIVQNVSRHFNDKTLMREKIVNKTLCQPLPQIKLPKIE